MSTIENEQKSIHQSENSHQDAVLQQPDSTHRTESQGTEHKDGEKNVARSGNDALQQTDLRSTHAQSYGAANSLGKRDPTGIQNQSNNLFSSSFANRSKYAQEYESRHGPPAFVRSNYEMQAEANTFQKVDSLAHHRHPSRDQNRVSSQFNGYEKHGGSPQRMSPSGKKYHYQRGNEAPSAKFVDPAPRYNVQPVVPKSNPSPLLESVSRSQNHRPAYAPHTQTMTLESNQSQPRIHSSNSNSNQNRTPTREKEGNVQRRTRGKENSANGRSSHQRPKESNALDRAAKGPAINAVGPVHDSIIRTYRREIANYSSLDRDFEALKARLADVQQRKLQQEDSLQTLQTDYENQLEQQNRVVQVLEQDLDQTKQENFDSNQESTDLARIISDTRSEVSSKDLQLSQLQSEIHRSREQQEVNKKDIQTFQQHIRESQLEKEMHQKKIYQLTAAFKQQDQECVGQTSKISLNNKQLEQLNDQCRNAEGTLNDRTQQVEDNAMKNGAARAEISRFESENGCLAKDIENSKQRNNFQIEAQRQLLRQRDNEANSGNELQGRLQDNNAKYQGLEGDLVGLGRELEQVRGSNEELLEIGHSLKQEVHALQNHADLLALQNNDLQKELDEFVMTDDLLRNGLDRKGRVMQIQQRVEHTISKSQHQLDKSKSPTRKSKSPLAQTQNYPQQQQQFHFVQHNESYHQGPAFKTQQSQCRESIKENSRFQMTQEQQYVSHYNSRQQNPSPDRSDNSVPTNFRPQAGSPLRRAA